MSTTPTTPKTLTDFTVTGLDGSAMPLADLAGRVVLVVNTASECGFTPQYAGLETIWQTYRDRGLTVLGFPCNQFGGQEPGTEEQIAQFCTARFGVTFPLTAKVEVNGPDADPVWQWLKDQKGGLFGDAIKWNFTKFLVGRDGQVIDRYAPQTTPESLTGAIEAALGAGA